MRLFLIRHGESEGNVDKSKYFEKLDCDIALTPKGEADAKLAADRVYNILRYFHLEKSYPCNFVESISLFHSTYFRATQTANIFSEEINKREGCGVARTFSSPLCREREWGSLRDIVESRMKTEKHFNFYYRPLNGESFADAYLRATMFHQWMMLNKGNYNNVVVVAHGEFNKVYLMHLLNWSIEQFDRTAHQKNGEVWLVEDNQLSSLTPLRKSKYSLI